jgi:hypothetical protein
MKNLTNIAYDLQTTTKLLNDVGESNSRLPLGDNIPMLRWGGGGRMERKVKKGK